MYTIYSVVGSNSNSFSLLSRRPGIDTQQTDNVCSSMVEQRKRNLVTTVPA